MSESWNGESTKTMPLTYPRMPKDVIWYCLYVFAFQVILLAPGGGATSSDTSGYANVSDAIPQLQDLVNFPLHRSPWVGGQNFTVCCLKAVEASYQIQSGQVSLTSSIEDRFIDLTPDELNATQFPCGATYNGSDAGAPLVTIPYSWCWANCGGWQQSTNRILTQWIQPFVGFILPSAVFCLNVPRKMVIRISDELFRGRSTEIFENYDSIDFAAQNIFEFLIRWAKLSAIILLVFLEVVLRGSWAASIALADTIIWVAIVFSTAAPMILSGLYEATLDRKVIERIQGNRLQYLNANRDTPDLFLKIHLLYAVLVGNLNLNHPEAGAELPASEGRSAWDDVEGLAAPFKMPLDDHEIENKNSTQIRLKGMLGCQASFGAAVGAPVVFFLGSFFFSVFSDLSAIGDNDTSHALAFGMWWMTIPHVAIIAGCLLAGNNPNTLEVIVCGLTSWPRSETPVEREHLVASGTFDKARRWLDATIKLTLFAHPDRENRTHFWHYLDLYRPFYDSVYQPVWLWERGRSKRTWIRRVERNFDNLRLPDDQKKPLKVSGSYVRFQRSKINNFNLGHGDWANVIIVALGLMAIPLVLAFLTSFYTPAVGMSCRSFTFLMYFVFQIVTSLVWLWDFQFEERSPLIQEMALPFGRTAYVPSSYCVIMTIGVIGSAFTTVAGTFLQILGTYRNCLCSIPMSAWSSRDYSIVISTNSADDIKYAKYFWLPTGVTSIVALIAVCYIGWWYQRHWRRRFTVVIDRHIWANRPSPDWMFPKGRSSGTEKQEGLKTNDRPIVTVRPMTESNGTGNSNEITRA